MTLDEIKERYRWIVLSPGAEVVDILAALQFYEDVLRDIAEMPATSQARDMSNKAKAAIGDLT